MSKKKKKCSEGWKEIQKTISGSIINELADEETMEFLSTLINFNSKLEDDLIAEGKLKVEDKMENWNKIN